MQPLAPVKTKPVSYADFQSWIEKVISKEGRPPSMDEFMQLVALFHLLFMNAATYANDIYIVTRSTDKNGIRLSIRRRDGEPCHDWNDFQEIKNQIVGANETMVEYYPPESQLLDTDNVYHLFSCSLSVPWIFGRHVWSK
jgi:hypothetical protein